VTFLSNVITACAILYNVLLNQCEEEVQWSLDILHREHAAATVSQMLTIIEEGQKALGFVLDKTVTSHATSSEFPMLVAGGPFVICRCLSSARRR